MLKSDDTIQHVWKNDETICSLIEEACVRYERRVALPTVLPVVI